MFLEADKLDTQTRQKLAKESQTNEYKSAKRYREILPERQRVVQQALQYIEEQGRLVITQTSELKDIERMIVGKTHFVLEMLVPELQKKVLRFAIWIVVMQSLIING